MAFSARHGPAAAVHSSSFSSCSCSCFCSCPPSAACCTAAAAAVGRLRAVGGGDAAELVLRLRLRVELGLGRAERAALARVLRGGLALREELVAPGQHGERGAPSGGRQVADGLEAARVEERLDEDGLVPVGRPVHQLQEEQRRDVQPLRLHRRRVEGLKARDEPGGHAPRQLAVPVAEHRLSPRLVGVAQPDEQPRAEQCLARRVGNRGAGLRCAFAQPDEQLVVEGAAVHRSVARESGVEGGQQRPELVEGVVLRELEEEAERGVLHLGLLLREQPLPHLLRHARRHRRHALGAASQRRGLLLAGAAALARGGVRHAAQHVCAPIAVDLEELAASPHGQQAAAQLEQARVPLREVVEQHEQPAGARLRVVGHAQLRQVLEDVLLAGGQLVRRRRAAQARERLAEHGGGRVVHRLARVLDAAQQRVEQLGRPHGRVRVAGRGRGVGERGAAGRHEARPVAAGDGRGGLVVCEREVVGEQRVEEVERRLAPLHLPGLVPLAARLELLEDEEAAQRQLGAEPRGPAAEQQLERAHVLGQDGPSLVVAEQHPFL
mmetsp:Transcript_29013/g.90800  ORF Transcript_29013/g.90800 Transcript_29013/m.90800 type:complete len:552 (-) Transcript_29013:2105-3760(-)